MSRNNEKISHIVNDVSVEQRVTDGFINATAMCVAHGKKVINWLATKETLELFIALADDLEVEGKGRDSGHLDISRLSAAKYVEIFPTLVISRKGSPDTGGGTWLHPDLAIQLAQWCNKPFAIQVSRWIREWMMTRQNPIRNQDDIERLVYRTTLKDESRLRSTNQVKNYLVKKDLYDDKVFTKQMFIDFHDSINVVLTGEPAWKMKQRLSVILGRKFKKDDLVRDYFPPIQLQQYIAINEAAANLMAKKGLHPIAAVQEAADLVLPMDYIPSPIDFVEHINKVRDRVALIESPTRQMNILPDEI